MVTQILEFLKQRTQFGIKPGLENMLALMGIHENPHLTYPVIHVAGTNGKGSTSSFIASILQEHGLQTGIYTSPHLVYLSERIAINGTSISDDDFIRIAELIRPFAEAHQLTFFETVTAIAFIYFREKKVDVAVIEVGMGGRLDATNIVQPLASVITSIGYDHIEHLGDTLTKIAGEKAGIIKPGVQVFTGNLPEEAEQIISQIAAENGSNLISSKSDVPGYLNRNADLAVRTSVFALEKLNVAIQGDKIQSGIQNMPENSGLNGRFQRFSKDGREIILDAAHNPDGTEALVEIYRFFFGDQKPEIIFGCVAGKDAPAMLANLKSLTDSIKITVPSLNRGNTTQLLGNQAKEAGFSVQEFNSFDEAFKAAFSEKKREPLIICGSLYLLGEAFSLFSVQKMVKFSPSGLTINH
ncbi:MAG: bifunctional folylpolyglutamate synthase/dihydrofolate synthase [Bacteroidetes bacterium]|nr:bifunctional folylpolyglutamate synthase/dihydrofolate synthase [Bacteroidota bacterium]